MHEPVSAAELDSPARIAPWEWGFVGVLCLAFLSFWVAHYHRFTLPNSDFLAIETTSKEIWSGQLPSGYKRMPMFPLLVGLLAQVIPAQRPHLEAALVLNIALSLGSIPLLFLFTRRLLGRGAIVTVVAYSTLWIFQEAALAPLVEPSLGFLILLSLVLWQGRSRWQYLALFAAAICRYEAVALIPICAGLNAAQDRRIGRHMLLAWLASTGFIVWMLLSVGQSAFVNPYVEAMREMGWPIGLSFILRAFRESYGDLRATPVENVMLGIALLLSAIGAWACWRKSRRETIAVLSFFAVYMMIHVGYGIDRARFVYPVAWIPITFLTFGLFSIAAQAEAWFVARSFVWNRYVSGLAAAIVACTAAGGTWLAFYSTSGRRAASVEWTYSMVLGIVLAATGLYSVLARKHSIISFAVAAVLVWAVATSECALLHDAFYSKTGPHGWMYALLAVCILVLVGAHASPTLKSSLRSALAGALAASIAASVARASLHLLLGDRGVAQAGIQMFPWIFALAAAGVYLALTRKTSVAGAAAAAAGASVALALACAGVWLMLDLDGILPGWVYGLLLGAVVLAAGAYVAFAHRTAVARALVTSCCVVALLTPVAQHGLRVQSGRSWALCYMNFSSYLTAEWLSENMRPGERAIVMDPGAVQSCFKFESRAIIGFNEMQAKNEKALAQEAEQGGVTYVCYCSRPPRAPDDVYDLYARRLLRLDLLDPLFKDGGDRPRFQHVATLDLPARMKQPPVHVYRLLPQSADAKAP